MRSISVLFVALTCLSLAGRACADAVTLDKPVYCEVFLKDAPARAGKVSGNLVSYDDESFNVQSGAKEQTLAWAQVTPASAYGLRARLIDKKSAADWLALGTFGWKIGAQDQAKTALKTAVRLDASLKEQADRITAAPAGELVKSDDDKPQPPKEDEAVVAQPGRKKADAAETVKPLKYVAATPEEHAKAIERAKKQAAAAEEAMKVTFQTFETDHFIVFTDWDAREFSFLKSHLEKAYTVVSKQFDISPKENVFVGKLPVYMWAKYDSFKQYAAEMDDFPVSDRVAGYYTGNNKGVGHMSMWKPTKELTGTSSLDDARRLWGYVLVHEFTHAFVARYRTNERIPRWMNEGIAEVIASGEVKIPTQNAYAHARQLAQQKVNVDLIFDDDNMPSGNYYPVMQTMVEVLVNKSHKNFIAMIDAIKDGTDPEDALKQFYKLDYAGLTKEWREYAARLNKN